jgi:hypothetical protein
VERSASNPERPKAADTNRGLAPFLERVLAGLPDHTRRDPRLLDALVGAGLKLPVRLWQVFLDEAVSSLARPARSGLLLELAERLPPDRRVPALGRLLWEQAERAPTGGRRSDPEHRLAVLLDTRGALLTEPTAVLVGTLLAVFDRVLPAPVPVHEGDLSPDHLAAALDSLGLLPPWLDLYRGLALACLAPRLVVGGLGTEGLLRAEVSVPERFGLRATVRRALGAVSPAPTTEDLEEQAEALEEPWRRFRALALVAAHVADRRRPLGEARLAAGGPILSPLAAAAFAIDEPYRRACAFETLALSAQPGNRLNWVFQAWEAVDGVSEPGRRARLSLRLVAAGLTPHRAGALRRAWWAVEAIEDPIARAELLGRLRRVASEADLEGLPAPSLFTPGDLQDLADDRRARLVLRHLEAPGPEGNLLLARAFARDLRGASQRIEAGSPAAARASLPRLDPALLQISAESRRRAFLARAEAGELDRATLEALVELLGSSDDCLRLRAALALHGDGRHGLPWRSAHSLGEEILFPLARHWLTLRRMYPRRAVALRWAAATVVHDSPRLLEALAGALVEDGPRAEEAEVLLLHLEALEERAAPALADLLSKGPPRAQRAAVRGLATVVGRGRGIERLWPHLARALPEAADAFGDEGVDLRGPLARVQAVEAVWRRLGRYGPEAGRAVRQEAASGEIAWREILRLPSEALLESLSRLGRLRLYGRRSQAKVRAAADRLRRQPEILPLIIDCAELRARQDVERLDEDDHEVSDLLQLLAVAVPSLQQPYLDATAGRPLWGRLLRDAAVEADWFPARLAALELAAHRGRLDAEALAGLLAALEDAPEVERAALRAVDHYRTLDDPEILGPLEEALASESPVRAFAAGRLLVRIALQQSSPTALFERVDAAIAGALAAAGGEREVYVSAVIPRSRGRILGIRCLGRLDHLLDGLRLDLHRTPELVREIEAASVEEPP